jgi:hypothetical protein
MPHQCSNPDNGDGKTFPAATPVSSPEFGVAQRDRNEAHGNVPGTPQWIAVTPDPELP